jgi:OOP family OmpA-OmpF porin
VIVGLVEAPGKKATPTETVIPQTLGGLLPLTLGVEGEGEFDFDKAVLREQVRVVLDEVAGKLKSAEYDRLEIVGHTDRIGTEVYNQYLSERRAWAVARYLIQQGVPVTKVAVEGRGMHEPITAANACAGLTREATIACLQDDRRVVISASIRRVDVDVH